MTLVNHIQPSLQQKHALATLMHRAEKIASISGLAISISVADLYNTGLNPIQDGNSLKFFDRNHRLVAEITKH